MCTITVNWAGTISAAMTFSGPTEKTLATRIYTCRRVSRRLSPSIVPSCVNAYGEWSTVHIRIALASLQMPYADTQTLSAPDGKGLTGYTRCGRPYRGTELRRS